MPTGKQQDEKWMGGQLKDACLGCSLIYVRAAICGRLDSDGDVIPCLVGQSTGKAVKIRAGRKI